MTLHIPSVESVGSKTASWRISTQSSHSLKVRDLRPVRAVIAGPRPAGSRCGPLGVGKVLPRDCDEESAVLPPRRAEPRTSAGDAEEGEEVEA